MHVALMIMEKASSISDRLLAGGVKGGSDHG